MTARFLSAICLPTILTLAAAPLSAQTTPVGVWFTGNRTFNANLDFGGRAITRITLDPNGRFPDRDATDNVWPRAGGGK